MKKITVLFVIIFAFSAIVSCGPQKQTVKEDNVKAEEKAPAEKPAEKKELTQDEVYSIRKYSSFANEAKKQKKYREMVEYINDVIEIDPEFKKAKKFLLYWRGQGYEELGLKDSARMDYERFRELDPTHKQVLILLDYMYVMDNDLDKAIEVVEQMIELDKEDKTLLKKLGKYHFQYAESLKLDDPEDPEIEEQANCAIDCFEEYTEEFAEDEEINNLLTYLISQFMDQSAFKAKLEENLESNPDDFKTMERLARIYYDEGNNEKAAELLEKIIKNDPENLKALKTLIRVTKSNINKAIKYNKMALDIDKDNELYNINLAKFYTEKKQYNSARKQCLAALKKNPKNTNIYKTWASIYTESIARCDIPEIEYQDKLVFTIAYGLYEKAGDSRRQHLMKESGQVPSKSDYFTNKSVKFPKRKCYNWINEEWNEVKFIQKYLKSL